MKVARALRVLPVLVVFVAGCGPGAAEDDGSPARVRFVAALADDGRVRFEITRTGAETDEVTHRRRADPGEATGWLDLPAGRYRVVAESDGRTVARAEWGFGKGDSYTALATGVVPEDGPLPRRTRAARLRRIFAGVEGVSANGLLPQLRLLPEPVDETGGHRIRLVHAAPGVQPLSPARRDGGNGLRAVGSPVGYPSAGTPVEVSRDVDTLFLVPRGGEVALAAVPISGPAAPEGAGLTVLLVGSPGGQGIRVRLLASPGSEEP